MLIASSLYEVYSSLSSGEINGGIVLSIPYGVKTLLSDSASIEISFPSILRARYTLPSFPLDKVPSISSVSTFTTYIMPSVKYTLWLNVAPEGL